MGQHIVHMLKRSVWTLLIGSTKVEHFQHTAERVIHLVLEEEARGSDTFTEPNVLKQLFNSESGINLGRFCEKKKCFIFRITL